MTLQNTPSEIDLLKTFNERAKPIKLDGELHYFNGQYYSRLESKRIGNVVFSILRHEFEQLGKAASMVRAISYLVNTSESEFPDISSSDYSRFLAFSNGILDCQEWNFWSHDSPTCPSVPATFHLPVEYDTTTPTAHSVLKNINSKPNLGKNPFLTDVISNDGYIKELFPTPTADNFFRNISGNNEDLIRTIYEMIAYIISSDTSAKAFFLFQGEPNTGKSVLGRFLEGYFPSKFVTSLDISRLGGQFLPDALSVSRLNLSMDLPNGELSKKAVAALKMLTGGDLITHEAKYKDAKPYRGQCKFVFATNHRLKLPEKDRAFLDRIICIPCVNPVPKAKQDADLLSKLEAERTNITMRALYYYRHFLLNNRKFTGTAAPQIDYRLSPEDTIREFVIERCQLTDGFTYTKDLYHAYTGFCIDNAYTPVSTKEGFAQRLSKLYRTQITTDRQRNDNGSENMRGFKGIILAQSNSSFF